MNKETATAKKEGRRLMVFHFFAGHGMMKNGSQCVLLNEFDKEENFYKTFSPEAAIRSNARYRSNTYHVAVFASCRENYKK